MCDSVPSARYSSVCNVLRLWRISLIPTYRVYRLYDIYTKVKEGKKNCLCQVENVLNKVSESGVSLWIAGYINELVNM